MQRRIYRKIKTEKLRQNKKSTVHVQDTYGGYGRGTYSEGEEDGEEESEEEEVVVVVVIDCLLERLLATHGFDRLTLWREEEITEKWGGLGH